eukprot:gene42649-34107_t
MVFRVVTALAAVGTASATTCGGVCRNNAACGGDLAAQCGTCFAVSPNPGKCGSGCNVKCDTDAQCLDPNCGVCSNGRCAQHRALGCADASHTDAECNAGSVARHDGLCAVCVDG